MLRRGWRLLLDSPDKVVAVTEDVLDDAPERGGSENRHDDVRESGSQDSHSQVVASEFGLPWSPRVEDGWKGRRRGSDLLRRCSGASWRTRSAAAPIVV